MQIEKVVISYIIIALYLVSLFRDTDVVVSIVNKKLSTIEENRILRTEPRYSMCDSEGYRESIEMSDERASLIRSGLLSHSYTESEQKYVDTEQRTYEPSETVHGPLHTIHQSAIMTDLQASMFLPSLLISSYSSVKRNYDQIVQQSVAQSMIRRSVMGSKSVMMSFVEKISDDRGATFGLTVANLLPCLLGSSLFALPFAIRSGGYTLLIVFILMSLLANFTSHVLIDSMYEISPRSRRRKRTSGDYVEIAKAAFGDKMSRLMNVILIFHLFSSTVVILILIGKAFFAVLSMYVSLSMLEMTAIFSTLVIPTLFVRKLSHLAYLSLLATFAILLGGLASLALFIRNYKAWEVNSTTVPLFEWNSFALGISIWLYTLIIHSIAPQVEGCMRQPAKITTAIHVSFILATLIKLVYGICGAMAFGMSTSLLVTDNVVLLSKPVGLLVNAAVGVYGITSFPLSFFVVGDTFDAICLGKDPKKHITLKKGGRYNFLWLLATRIGLVGVALAIAVGIPYFGPVVGILGAILGTLLVFFLPCLFHLKMKWKKMSFKLKSFEIFVMIVGVTAGCIGLYASLRSLVNEITGS